MARRDGTVFPLLPGELSNEELRTERSKYSRESRDLVWRATSSILNAGNGGSIVAHQQWACFARAEPLTLLAKGKLHIIYVEQNSAVDKLKLIGSSPFHWAAAE